MRTARRGSSGVVLPLVAAIVAGVAALFFYLAVVVPVFEERSLEFRQTFDLVCKNSLEKMLPSQRGAMGLFRDELNKVISGNTLRGTTISAVDVGMITMPGNGSYGFAGQADLDGDSNYDSCDDNASGYTPLNPGAGSSFASLLGSGCNLTGGADCQYHFDFCTDSTLKAQYPKSMGTNLGEAGVTVMCSASADITAWFITRPVSTKSVFTSKLRAPEPIYDPVQAVLTSQALSVFVDPFMTTDQADQRFLFSQQNPTFDAQMVASFSPFLAMVGQVPKNYFQSASLAHVYNGFVPPWWMLGAGNVPAPYVARPAGGPKLQPIAALIGGPVPLTPAQISDIGVAIVNPPTVVRNLIATTILELASRTPLRNMTEVMVFNAHHAHHLKLGQPVEPNSPVQVVYYGDDLRSPQFQQPFLYSHGGSGGVGAYNAVFTPAPGFVFAGTPLGLAPAVAGAWQMGGLQGTTFPFGATNGVPVPAPFAYPNPADEAAMRTFHAVRAGWLRLGYHMYRGLSGGGNVMDGVDRWWSFGIDNHDFEPPNYLVSAGLAPRPYPVAGSTLDQENPWPVSPAPAPMVCTPGDPLMPNSTCMNATDVVASMTAAQGCIFNGEPMYQGLGCMKPPLGWGYDLRPDIRAGLQSLVTKYQTLRVNSPGMFLPDLVGQNAANNTKIAVPTFAFGPMNYRAALPVDSSAVVILTNPPLQTEAPLIQTIVQELNNRNRAVTVFYVPTNGRDASAATIAMVQGAFLDSTEAVPSLNKVYTFYPYDPAFGGQYGPTGNEALDFANYYRDLLDPNHSMYLPPKIRDVFAMGIMRLELRL